VDVRESVDELCTLVRHFGVEQLNLGVDLEGTEAVLFWYMLVPASMLDTMPSSTSSICFVVEAVVVEKMRRAGQFTMIAATISANTLLPVDPTVGTITVRSSSVILKSTVAIASLY
jgi:hypothetical protein